MLQEILLFPRLQRDPIVHNRPGEVRRRPGLLREQLVEQWKHGRLYPRVQRVVLIKRCVSRAAAPRRQRSDRERQGSRRGPTARGGRRRTAAAAASARACRTAAAAAAFPAATAAAILPAAVSPVPVSTPVSRPTGGAVPVILSRPRTRAGPRARGPGTPSPSAAAGAAVIGGASSSLPPVLLSFLCTLLLCG